MKKTVLIVAALLLAGSVAFAQTESTGVGDSVTAKVVVHVGPNTVEVTARHADGTVFYHTVGHNLKTYVGGDMICSAMSNTSTQAAAANYLAVSSDAGSPAAGDTTLASEITTSGLGRAQGTYAHTTCVSYPCTYTLAHTWTASGALSNIQKAAVFNAASSGTLVFENTFSPVTMASGDTLQVTWTISLS